MTAAPRAANGRGSMRSITSSGPTCDAAARRGSRLPDHELPPGPQRRRRCARGAAVTACQRSARRCPVAARRAPPVAVLPRICGSRVAKRAPLERAGGT